jgi:predicted metal-binding membrane protein
MPGSWANAPAVLARRERAVVLVALGVTIALAWAWLLAGGPGMAGMDGGRPGPALWSGATLIIFAMWSVMMAAMMLPGAAPAILLFAALSRSRASTTAFPSTGIFAAGYLLVWAAFAAVATAAHVRLQQAALLSPALRSTSVVLAAALLIAAGIYQFTPLKGVCVRHCRAPAQFFTRHWRSGGAGALRLGVLHGVYCVGCCWALMGLLFVGGVMNLWWVAVIAVFIAVEKIAFLGALGGRIASGAGLVLAGAVALAVMQR